MQWTLVNRSIYWCPFMYLWWLSNDIIRFSEKSLLFLTIPWKLFLKKLKPPIKFTLCKNLQNKAYHISVSLHVLIHLKFGEYLFINICPCYLCCIISRLFLRWLWWIRLSYWMTHFICLLKTFEGISTF